MNRKYRKTIIAGNWKMNKLPSEVRQFAETLKPMMSRATWCETVLCVPFVMIPAAVRAFKDTRIAIGAQDVSCHEDGAYTGEVSAAQLRDVGVKYVIIGHSERRVYHGETDTLVNKKVLAAIGEGLIPIICVGETAEQRQMGIMQEYITMQVKAALCNVPAEKIRKTIIAYEPLWAVGSGNAATDEQAAAVCRTIRAVIRGLYGARIARAVTVQYGGSMDTKNASGLLAMPDIDGGLIGGASLKADELAGIINASNQ